MSETKAHTPSKYKWNPDEVACHFRKQHDGNFIIEFMEYRRISDGVLLHQEVLSVTKRIKRDLAGPRLPVPRAAQKTFTPRESQLIPLIKEGFSTKEIASRLGITEKTVKFHLTGIFKKTGCSNRTKLLIRLFESATV